VPSAIRLLGIILGAFACQAGLWAPIWAIALAGAGHGWVSPLFPSLGFLLAGPLAGAAWVWRDRRWGVLLGCLLALLFIASDYLLWSRTEREGLGYFWKAWDYGPSIMVVWFSAWLYPRRWSLPCSAFG